MKLKKSGVVVTWLLLGVVGICLLFSACTKDVTAKTEVGEIIYKFSDIELSESNYTYKVSYESGEDIKYFYFTINGDIDNSEFFRLVHNYHLHDFILSIESKNSGVSLNSNGGTLWIITPKKQVCVSNFCIETL